MDRHRRSTPLLPPLRPLHPHQGKTVIRHLRQKTPQLKPQGTARLWRLIKVTIAINNHDIDLLNVYCPGRSLHIAKQIEHFKPRPKTYIAGDFNAHHTWWYADQSVRTTNNIRNHKTQPNIIVQWMSQEGMTLGNTPGIYIFHRNEDSRTIIDLTIYQGICTRLIQNWNVDKDGQGSDHLPSSTVWNIQKETFTPTKA